MGGSGATPVVGPTLSASVTAGQLLLGGGFGVGVGVGAAVMEEVPPQPVTTKAARTRTTAKTEMRIRVLREILTMGLTGFSNRDAPE